MLKKFLFTGFILLSVLCYSQQEEKKLLRIEGTITDSKLQPVAYAHILIPAREVGCVGDYYGNFSLGAYPGDTILISAVSFHKKHFIVPDSLSLSGMGFHFMLEQDTVQLAEQVIYPWPETYDEFKKEFVATKTEDPLENLDLHLPSPQELQQLARADGTISLKGPISLLYDRFSHEAKTQRELQKLNYREKAKARYNPTVVSIVTGIKDEEQIKKLMDYCDLSDQFVVKSNDYELYSAILYCYNEFSQQPAENK